MKKIHPPWVIMKYGLSGCFNISIKFCQVNQFFTLKSEQQRLTPKYDILCYLVPLVKQYFVTVEEVYNQFKIACQYCSYFLTCKGCCVELLYITFLRAVFSTLGLFPGDIYLETFYFQSTYNWMAPFWSLILHTWKFKV